MGERGEENNKKGRFACERESNVGSAVVGPRRSPVRRTLLFVLALPGTRAPRELGTRSYARGELPACLPCLPALPAWDVREERGSVERREEESRGDGWED